MKKLSVLLDGIAPWPSDFPLEITGLCSDSRQTKAADLFIAAAGPMEFRPRFIQQALSKGAAAVLQEADNATSALTLQKFGQQTIPILAIPDLKAQVGPIAARFYQDPSCDLTTIGITGTNGKTSCSQFIAAALSQLNSRCGVIGTLGYGFPEAIQPGFLTTPDAISLQRILAELKAQKAQCVAMEVSSHSLAQHRVAGVKFDIAVFTNLTRDHLDYHGSMEAYGQVKRQLFLRPLQAAIINADDAFGRQLLEEFSTKLPCYAYTTQNAKATATATISASEIQLNARGFSAQVSSPWGQGLIQSPLLGRFNLSNLLASVATLGILGMPWTDILRQVSALSTINGRMQALGGINQPLVVVDYSHTPDALEQALIALREHCSGTLWCVFGCGGNRDAGKRPLMGQIAQRYSDRMIITTDNPRFEDPQRITDDILSGLQAVEDIQVEHDRQRAIAYAIHHAQAGDVVLVAGKGHENYQQIGAEKLPFNDVEQVLRYLIPSPL